MAGTAPARGAATNHLVAITNSTSQSSMKRVVTHQGAMFAVPRSRNSRQAIAPMPTNPHGETFDRATGETLGESAIRAVPGYSTPGTMRMSRTAPPSSAARASWYAGLSCAARAASTESNSTETVRVLEPAS